MKAALRLTTWVEPRVVSARDSVHVQAHCADCPWFKGYKVVGGYSPKTIREAARRHVLISGHMVRQDATVRTLLRRSPVSGSPHGAHAYNVEPLEEEG